METLNSFAFGREFCFQINGHRSPWGHDSDPCFSSTGMLSLFFFVLFEWRKARWGYPTYLSVLVNFGTSLRLWVLCVWIFSLYCTAHKSAEHFGSKIQIMYTRDKSAARMRRTGCFVKARAGMTNPLFFFFEEAAFFFLFHQLELARLQ